MRSAFLLLPVALTLAGCCRPLHLVTNNRNSLDTPVIGHITVNQPSTNDNGPVVAMPVDGCGCEGPKVAIVDVDGLLLNYNLVGASSVGENPVAVFREKLNAVAADPTVCAVVLRINSPGGGAAATEVMWQDLQAFRAKRPVPVVACLLDLGAGGAYHLASAADLIVAYATTVTGGIGVIFNSYNLDNSMAQYNVFAQPVKAGQNIDMGTVLTELKDDAKAALESIANEFHANFKAAIVQARPRIKPDDETTFDGRVFTARQALERGLIDRIGTLDFALAAARDLACVPKATAVLYHRKNDPAYSPYAVTPNVPIHPGLFPLSLPGFDRSRLPAFLYMWQPEPTMEKIRGW